MRQLTFGFSVCILLLAACCSQDVPVACVVPPPTSQAADHSKLVTLSVKLEKLPLDADFSAKFNDTVSQSFQTLSDKNATLYLFLQAIDCYLRHGKVGERIAQEMADFVRASWAQTTVGQRGTPPALTPDEINMIKQTPYKEEIYARFREFGVGVPAPSDVDR
jgi:hypothetical protein